MSNILIISDHRSKTIRTTASELVRAGHKSKTTLVANATPHLTKKWDSIALAIDSNQTIVTVIAKIRRKTSKNRETPITFYKPTVFEYSRVSNVYDMENMAKVILGELTTRPKPL